MEKYKEMGEIFSTLDDELRKFYETGNQAAGVRARNMLLEIRKISQDIRCDILKHRLGLKK